MKKRTFILPAIFALLLNLTGCVSLWSKGGSGFLVDYSSLKPDPKQEKVFYFRNPQMSSEVIVEQYPAVMIEPVVVYFDSDALGLAVDPGELKGLTDRFRNDLVKALVGSHPLVDIPGPKVARIRIAFSGIAPSRFRLSPHPELTAIDLGNASMEAEMIDSKTAERISALMDTRNRSGYVKLDGTTIRKHAETVIGDWIDLVAGWLDGLYAVQKPLPEPKKEDKESDPVPGTKESKP